MDIYTWRHLQKLYIYLLCTYTEYCLEDLPKAMADRVEGWEWVKESMLTASFDGEEGKKNERGNAAAADDDDFRNIYYNFDRESALR